MRDEISLTDSVLQTRHVEHLISEGREGGEMGVLRRQKL